MWNHEVEPRSGTAKWNRDVGSLYRKMTTSRQMESPNVAAATLAR
jgi:hypothetical protein